MRASRLILPVLLGLSTLGLGALAWKQHAEITRLRLELEQANTEMQGFQERMTAAEGRARLAQENAHITRAAPEASSAPEQTKETSAEKEQNRLTNEALRAAMRKLERSPEYQELMRIQTRGSIEQRYADLFRRLRLPPEALENFKNLLLEKTNVARDTLEIAQEKGLGGPQNSEKLRSLIRSAETELEESIRQSIGDAAYAKYRDYEATAPQRSLSSRLADRLSYTASPLTEDQSEQLVRTLVANKIQPGPGTERGSAITPAVMEQARSFLSAPQIAALEQFQAEQEAMQKAAQLRRQLRQTPPPANTPGSPTP